jgi:hypothetical protein
MSVSPFSSWHLRVWANESPFGNEEKASLPETPNEGPFTDGVERPSAI